MAVETLLLVTYEYVVDGITYTSDRWSYATEGLERAVAERTLAAVPEDVGAAALFG